MGRNNPIQYTVYSMTRFVLSIEPCFGMGLPVNLIF